MYTMQPFYQGKVDAFCAIYAVLNAMLLLYDIRPGKARELLNAALVDASRDALYFLDVLNHKTDYMALVDRMLARLQTEYGLRVESLPQGASKPELWNALASYAEPEARRTAVFRFCRHVPLTLAPLTDHWTTALRMEGDTLRLFDSSLEPSGLYALHREGVAVRAGVVNREYVVIPPEHVRLLSRG